MNSQASENKRLSAANKELAEANRKLREQLKQSQTDLQKRDSQIQELQNSVKSYRERVHRLKEHYESRPVEEKVVVKTKTVYVPAEKPDTVSNFCQTSSESSETSLVLFLLNTYII